MGDGGTKFNYDSFSDVMQVEFSARAAQHIDAAEVRKALSEALKHIPEAKLKGVRSFRLLIIPQRT